VSKFALALTLLAALTSLAFSQQPNDKSYTDKIQQYTTEKFFLTELVDHLPASSIPTPEKILGHICGAPDILSYTQDVNRYMRELAKATNRVKVFSMGKSEEGREMILVAVSDAANLQKLERYKLLNAALTDPRKTTEAQAQRLIKEDIPMYWATGAMHSPESGSPEMLMELAYRLAVEDTPFIKDIRKNCIFLITPVLETDGRDRYVDTYLYRKKNPKKTPIPLIYWGHYVAHDNNRDGMSVALQLTQNVMRTWFDYHPLVLHDLHESVPYIYISTGTGPYNAWLDPITIDEWHTMAYTEIEELTKRGMPGVWTHGFYDGWAPNYMFYAANGHNAIGRFYETFGGNGADTAILSADNSTREWDRPFPPFPKVRWSIRDNVNMQQSGLLFGLKNVADNRERFLSNYWEKCKRSIAKAHTEGPAAYVIAGESSGNPAVLSAREGYQQRAARLVRLLQKQGVEVQQLTQDVTLGATTSAPQPNAATAPRSNTPPTPTAPSPSNPPSPSNSTAITFPKGSYVIRMDQPNSRMADMMLDKQFYNVSDPTPYDDTGWTLGPLFNVNVTRVTDAAILNQPMQPAVATISLPAANPPVTPRIALLHTWTSTQDEGWARLALEDAHVPYAYISTHTVRDTPNIKEKYDVIIFPETRGTAQSIVNGRPKDGDPIPFKPLPGFPNLGGPDQTDDIRGGIELPGMVNLQKFLQDGGLFICIGNACRVPIDYGLVSGVSITQPRQLQLRGSVLSADVVRDNPNTQDTTHKTSGAPVANPILAGYGDNVGVYFSGAPVLNIGGNPFGGFRNADNAQEERASGRGDQKDQDVIQTRPAYTPAKVATDNPEDFTPPTGPKPRVLLKFASPDKLLISGMLGHGEELAGKPAVILCPVGKGNVMLMAINPFWRQETIGSWPLVFNAAYNYDRLQTKTP